jgi:hypothetical protein
LSQSASNNSISVGHPLVTMRFRPAWTYIDGIRDFGEFFCRTTFAESDVADRACVVIQETLENAIKYSRDDSDSELELTIAASGNTIEFSVTSKPSEEHLGSLKEELERLNHLEPEQAFMSALERAQNEPSASARLGLARMRYEGAVELKLADQPDGRIRLTAIGKL